MIRIYLAHYIRGLKGNNATIDDEIKECERAIDLAYALRAAFPSIEFYVPAEHEEFVRGAYNRGMLTIAQILEVDCAILDTCNAVFFFKPDGVLSRGMQVEYDHCTEIKKPTTTLEKFDSHAMTRLSFLIEELEGNHNG